jgi:hypothetical protein
LFIGGLTAVTLVLCFMPTPIETETIAWSQMRVLDQDGTPIATEELSDWWNANQKQH